MPAKIGTCKFCGEAFTFQRRSKEFCDDRCRNAYGGELEREEKERAGRDLLALEVHEELQDNHYVSQVREDRKGAVEAKEKHDAAVAERRELLVSHCRCNSQHQLRYEAGDPVCGNCGKSIEGAPIAARIRREYKAGKSPDAIAAQLTREQIPAAIEGLPHIKDWRLAVAGVLTRKARLAGGERRYGSLWASLEAAKADHHQKTRLGPDGPGLYAGPKSFEVGKRIRVFVGEAVTGGPFKPSGEIKIVSRRAFSRKKKR